MGFLGSLENIYSLHEHNQPTLTSSSMSWIDLVIHSGDAGRREAGTLPPEKLLVTAIVGCVETDPDIDWLPEEMSVGSDVVILILFYIIC